MSNALNDPEKWVMKGQTAIKHQVLNYYLGGFATILSNLNRQAGRPTVMHYIDCFGGRGVYQDGDCGSPIIAMRVAQEVFNNSQGKALLRVHAIELDPDNFQSLQSETDRARSSYPDVEVQLYPGKFEERIAEIMGKIGPYEFAFVFIDPFGYREAALENIMRLIARPRTEVFVTFMSHTISRYYKDKTGTKDRTMAAVFGDVQLMELKRGHDKQQRLAYLYGRAIQRMGQEQGVGDILVSSVSVKYDGQTDKKTIYHLVHLTRDSKGKLVMEKAIRNADILEAVPQLEWQVYQLEVKQSVLDFLAKQRGSQAKARDVAGIIWFDYWMVTWQEEIRELFKALEEDGAVEITRNGKPLTSRMKVAEDDLIKLKA